MNIYPTKESEIFSSFFEDQIFVKNWIDGGCRIESISNDEIEIKPQKKIKKNKIPENVCPPKVVTVSPHVLFCKELISVVNKYEAICVPLSGEVIEFAKQEINEGINLLISCIPSCLDEYLDNVKTLIYLYSDMIELSFLETALDFAYNLYKLRGGIRNI